MARPASSALAAKKKANDKKSSRIQERKVGEREKEYRSHQHDGTNIAAKKKVPQENTTGKAKSRGTPIIRN